MMQEEKKQNKKLSKQRSPKVQSFVRPFEKRAINGNDDDFSDYYNDIGKEIFLSDCDPNGSYTGITRDGDNRPVQDADDL